MLALTSDPGKLSESNCGFAWHVQRACCQQHSERPVVFRGVKFEKDAPLVHEGASKFFKF